MTPKTARQKPLSKTRPCSSTVARSKGSVPLTARQHRQRAVFNHHPLSRSRRGLLKGYLYRLGRRLRIGQAYDMAEEILNHLPSSKKAVPMILDVGCGNGFIAHHLSALARTPVRGVDIGSETEAPIHYEQYDGSVLPFSPRTFDGVLLCYVLHHCDTPVELLKEIRRVLRSGGRVVVYEDVPATWFDRLLCLRHDRLWRSRVGSSTFYSPVTWRALFEASGFKIRHQRYLSRWRDWSNPVQRIIFVLESCARC